MAVVNGCTAPIYKHRHTGCRYHNRRAHRRAVCNLHPGPAVVYCRVRAAVGGTMDVKIKLLTDTARVPTYATDGSAAFDIYADMSINIDSDDFTIIKG